MTKNHKRRVDRPTSTQGRLDGSGSGSRLATYAVGGIVSLVLVVFAAAAFASSNQSGEEVESLEAVMNLTRNGLGMRKTEIAEDWANRRKPRFYAVFSQVHNTL
jgi:hypothetical protein